jgi:hypothetical protein
LKNLQTNSHHGTLLIVLPIHEGVVIGADDLVSTKTVAGVSIPTHTQVPKIFVASNRIIIGSTQNMWMKLHKPFVFEYKVDNWIADFIANKAGGPESNPEDVATRIYEEARKTFQPIDSLVREGKWDKQNPGETFVNYLVAGYSKDFGDYSLFHIGVELDIEGKGLNFAPPRK